MPDTENRLVVAKRRGGGGMDREFGISIDKLVYIGWINNKVLLYNMYVELCSILCSSLDGRGV